VLKLGYNLMSEEHGPKDLVRNAARAEEAGPTGTNRPSVQSSEADPSERSSWRAPRVSLIGC
jgi:hypothetical protein